MRLKTFRVTLLISCCLAGLAVSVQAQSAGQYNWKRYEIGKGKLSALFPGPPKEEFRPSAPDMIVSSDAYIYSVRAAGASFVAQYTILGEAAEEWSEGSREIFYEGVWKGASTSLDKEMEDNKIPFRTKMDEVRQIKFSGYSGHEVVFTVGPMRGRLWMTLIGRQAFGAMVVGTDTATVEDQDRFLNSVTINLKPTPVKQIKTNKQAHHVSNKTGPHSVVSSRDRDPGARYARNIWP